MIRTKLMVCGLLPFIMVSCAELNLLEVGENSRAVREVPFTAKKMIRKEDFGDKWPFTVSEGELRCHARAHHPHPLARYASGPFLGVTLATGREEYAVNGTADSFGFTEVNPIWKDDPVWEEENYLAAFFGGSGPKVSLTPIIRAGLELCK